MKALIWFPTRIICSDLCLNCKPITQNYRQDVHKICISRDFLCLHCLWNMRFESNLPGSIPKILKSDRDSMALEPDPESWRFWVESNLTSRDSLRGLVVTIGNGVSKNMGQKILHNFGSLSGGLSGDLSRILAFSTVLMYLFDARNKRSSSLK